MKRICLLLAGLAVFSIYLYASELPWAASKTKVVVRASRSGRLVRHVIPPKFVLPDPPVLDSTSAAPGRLQQIVDEIAERHELEPDLVHSVIRVESNYNPYAISPKGARGLMQLIPATARRFGVTNSFNPVENVEGGVRYLKQLLQMYHDSLPLALAAYNAGEAAVARYGGIPPYPETQSYVRQVGKRVEARRAARKQVTRPAPPAPQPAPEHNPIRQMVDASGRVTYVTY